MRGLWIVLFSVVSLLSGAVLAADGPYDMEGRWGLGFGVGGHSSGNSDLFIEQTDEEFAAAMWLRYHMSTSWALELSYDHLEYDGSDPTNSAVDLSIAVRFWAKNRFRVLLQAGAGWMGVRNYPGFAERTYSALTAKGRLGFEYMLNPKWALALHGDYHYVDVKKEKVSELHIFAPMLAVTYYFGDGAPSDSDGDGITDDLDKCPGTLVGEKIDANGCPVPVEKKVVDSDYDGVPDDADQCPGSVMGAPVEANGCPPKKQIEFTLNVKFASGKSVVQDQYKKNLEEFAAFMKKYPATKAEIQGHTDSTGSEKFNNFISEKRANAVRKYMIDKFAISADRLTAKGYGPSQPVGDNTTVEGRSQNRRVVATISTKE